VLEKLEPCDAKAARANRRHGAGDAARMRDQILGPDFDATETGVANDAELVLERTRERDGVDRETGKIHDVNRPLSIQHCERAELVGRRASESEEFEIQRNLLEQHVGANLDRAAALARGA